MFKALVVDDDPNVCEIIKIYFEKHQIKVIEAYDGKTGLELVNKEVPDVIILDLMLPVIDGYGFCREIRKNYDIPIIMLTAKGEEFDRVLGLELGADDYVTKPFSPRELVARIKAIFRRLQLREQTGDNQKSKTYDFQGLSINVERREVIVNGEKVELRPKEFDLLVFLADSPSNVFTREQILDQVWGYDYVGDIRTVDVHIKKLRMKLSGLKDDCIQTVWGVGYKFEVES